MFCNLFAPACFFTHSSKAKPGSAVCQIFPIWVLVLTLVGDCENHEENHAFPVQQVWARASEQAVSEWRELCIYISLIHLLCFYQDYHSPGCCFTHHTQLCKRFTLQMRRKTERWHPPPKTAAVCFFYLYRFVHQHLEDKVCLVKGIYAYKQCIDSSITVLICLVAPKHLKQIN